STTKRSEQIQTRAWPDTQAECAVFSSANLAKICAESVRHDCNPTAAPLWSEAQNLPPHLHTHVPKFEVHDIGEGGVNRMRITKTGNPFCRSIGLSKSLTKTEAGRILHNHFQVLLIAICIDRDRSLKHAVLQISFAFLQGRIVPECCPVNRAVNDLWRNKIIPFRDVVAILIHVNTQMRSALGHPKNHRSRKEDIGVHSV